MLGREAGLAEGGEEGVTRSSHVHLPTQPDECLVGTQDHCGGMLIHTGERVTMVTQGWEKSKCSLAEEANRIEYPIGLPLTSGWSKIKEEIIIINCSDTE